MPVGVHVGRGREHALCLGDEDTPNSGTEMQQGDAPGTGCSSVPRSTLWAGLGELTPHTGKANANVMPINSQLHMFTERPGPHWQGGRWLFLLPAGTWAGRTGQPCLKCLLVGSSQRRRHHRCI